MKNGRWWAPGAWARLVATAATGLMLLGGASVHAEECHVFDKKKVRELQTALGKLEITKVETGGAEGEVWRVTFADKTIGRVSGAWATFSAACPDAENPQLLLLATSGGGRGCPRNYHFVEIRPDGTGMVSEEFGNCMEHFRMSGKVGRWQVAVVNPEGRSVGPDAWVYAKGRAVKINKRRKRASAPRGEE